jgi:hypothetical protein
VVLATGVDLVAKDVQSPLDAVSLVWRQRRDMAERAGRRVGMLRKRQNDVSCLRVRQQASASHKAEPELDRIEDETNLTEM